LLIILTLGSITVGAVDLPIDIDIIGQESGSGEAYTANTEVEIFTPNAQEITQAIDEHSQKTRETQVADIFLPDNSEETSSINEQITQSAANSVLFEQPANYSGMRMSGDDSPISIWVIIILFVVSIICGFVLARILIERRKREEDVH